MENKKEKCSFKEHREIDAISYCQECKIYMCNKCIMHHTGLFDNHQQYNIDKSIKDIFTGYCKEINHFNKLEFYCKTHCKLCCVACISKIRNNFYGQHKDCDICAVEDIKEEKKMKLEENIKCLEELLNKLETSINELKIFFEKINEKKEGLKLNIQQIFTKIRNTLNDREDELLIEVDKQFNYLYFNEDIIKENGTLPNKIKILLEKRKTIENDWNNDNKLYFFINYCINIENNIKNINQINEKINICKINQNIKINFYPHKEDEINKFLNSIKKFGKINWNKFRFKICPINIKEGREYSVTGENQNILTKTAKNSNWIGTFCENELEKSEIYKWKIKILKSKTKNILIGVAPIDFDINSSDYNYGWYFACDNLGLYSGPPYNYKNKKTNLSKVKDEITVIMNMNKRTLKFIINNEDKGDSYTDIPLDKPISPAVCLVDTNDSIEIIEC